MEKFKSALVFISSELSACDILELVREEPDVKVSVGDLVSTDSDEKHPISMLVYRSGVPDEISFFEHLEFVINRYEGMMLSNENPKLRAEVQINHMVIDQGAFSIEPKIIEKLSSLGLRFTYFSNCYRGNAKG